MLGINEMNQELVRAFNINLCYNDIAITNLTMQNLDGKDYIVISFDKNMKHGQRMKYLSALKDKIIKRSYKDEKAAGVSYNLQSFPFNFNKGRLEKDNKGKRFSVEIDEGVVFNLKCYLAQALAGDVQEDIGKKFGVKYVREHIYDISFDRSSYLLCMRFDDLRLKVYFINSFSSKIARYEENAPRDYLEIIGNCVYIKKSIFDNVEFIKDIEAHNASLICRDFQTPSSKDKGVEDLKFPIISFIRKTDIPVHSVIRTSYEGSNEDSVLIPIVAKSGKGNRLLDDNDAYKINSAFNMEILSDVSESISVRLPKSDSSDSIIYGVDFSDLDIAYCVLNKIMESSVINAKHELAIDPELVRALSPAQSPFNSPTHAGPSGLETPPNPRKRNRDSGLGESPPRPEDSVAPSPSGGPSSYFTESLSPTQEFPTRDQNVVLKDSPRRESEKFPVLLPVNQLDVPGTSREFLPRSHLSSSVTNPHSSKCVGAVQNVQAGTSAWSQPINPWSSPAPSAGLWSLPQSGPSSWKGASERRTSDKPLTEEEEKLSKALLYWFNLNNYALDPPHTNFIVKNGKIASLIDDSVDVKEYLQEVIDKTKEEYCVNKKEAYDLNEFPFKFLSNCEKNQETTVVANISRGALLNLKELFSQEHEGKVEIKDIDINIVKKAVKSKKDKWVNFQVREHGLSPKAAIETCCPDESALEYISITKGEGGHWIDRNYDASEVKSFREERWPAKGTSKAEKMKSEDNKDSGYSSGFVTDAENVSSKAEATTSGYESMDCENTRGGSPKRKSPSPEDGGNPRKSPKRDSLPLSRLESLSLSSSSHQIGKC